MSHDHSMFFIIICLCICSCNGTGFEKPVDYLGPTEQKEKVYGLERWLTNCSKAKMKMSSSQASSSLVGCFASP